MKPVKITGLRAREVLDSRGLPTVEVEISSGPFSERAMVPSGASTGEAEALELRDGDAKRFGGKGVLKAVQNVEKRIGPLILGREFARLPLLDDALRELDGTENKSNLGANAILGVSMAFCRLQARCSDMSLREYLATTLGSTGLTLPVPLMNVINGGKHADNSLAIQEFMIAPAGFSHFPDALRAGSEIFHELRKTLHSRSLSTGVGDEGGFAPMIPGNSPHEDALKLLVEAIRSAGYEPGKNVWIALDCASSEFCEMTGDRAVYSFEGKRLSSKEMLSVYQTWIDRYPICSIEDGFGEHDWGGWALATQSIGSRCQLVGDDLYATNTKILKKGIDQKASNAILIKVNQIGTVTESLETMKLARAHGIRTVVSHRSGETEDSFIADLAVATDAGQIKTGSLCRSERISKYNQLLRLNETLGSKAIYPGRATFSNG